MKVRKQLLGKLLGKFRPSISKETIVILVLMLGVFFWTLYPQTQVKGVNSIVIPIIELPTPTNEPTPTTISQNTAPPIDSDPVMTCNTKSQGQLQVKKSVCVSLVDCQIGGKYYLAQGQEMCNDWVAKYNQSRSTSYTPPSTSNVSQYVQNMNTISQNAQQESLQAQQQMQNTANQPVPTIPIPTASQQSNCYTSWSDYFKDHPGSGYVAGLGTNPPCH